MTAPVGRPARFRRLPSWPQWGGTLVAVAASLAALSLPGPARADTSTGYDQMTGIGPTASAISVSWTQGLLDSSNQPITSATPIDGSNSDRSSSTPQSKLSFMYSDFKNLQVKVSQTQNIGHQGITVSWTGGLETTQLGSLQANFLQMMECWGDATTGPTPDQCEYGSLGLLPGNVLNPGIGERTGPLCPAGSVPSLTTPPRSADGSGPTGGCDTLEPGTSNLSHLAPCPAGTSCTPTQYTIPFTPVTDPTHPNYDPGITYYSEFNTDEVQEAVTASDGTGQLQFETLTGIQAPGLGCGQAEASGQPRGCWLVIVPRGNYEPNGYKIVPGNTNSLIDTSPLGASNWAQRIQIHLDFAPVGSFCQPGTLERQTFGTQLAARAMQSWQLALNAAAKCAKVYGYSAVPETQSTNNLNAGGDSGLAFTTIPIGSEATRSGGTPSTTLPTILYAPVAIAALGFSFNINYHSSYITTPVKLTPLLLAKALTQSYLEDLPDFYPNGGKTGPTWAQNNPLNISEDPAFHALNQEVPQDTVGPISPLITEDHSQVNQQVWQWIQASSAATAWLGGTKDTSNGNNMAVDPDYQALNLGTTSTIDSYPRAYNGVLDLTSLNPPEGIKHSLDLLPYTDNLDSAGSAVLTANSPDEGSWSPLAIAPDGSLGWWAKIGVEPIQQIFIWGAVDTPDSAAYGLIPAQLCDDSGSNCVSPSTASVTAAVGAATTDKSGLLHVDPAHPGTGAYPLTYVIYAAVPTNQSAAALNDYADLIAYAAGTGQTPGATPGDLPPGYLPLPSNLASQAQAVVTQLRGLASPSPSPSPSTSSSSPSTSTSTPAGSSSSSSPATTATTPASATTTAGAAAVTGGATPTPTPATTPTQAQAATSSLARLPVTSSSRPAVALSYAATTGPVVSLPQAQVAAGSTPNQPVGGIRWVLIGVAVLGGGFAGGGTLLRSGGTWPWRRRTVL